MSDETAQSEVRQHGKRGMKRMRDVAFDAAVSAKIPAIDATLPTTYDTTHGRNLYPILDNDESGNCGEVSLAVATMNQACTGLNDRQQPVYVDGYTEPDDAVVDGWYHDIATMEGEPFTTGEGPGTSPYALAKYALQKNIVLAAGVLGTVAPEVIAQATYDTKGGAIVTWALDDDCFQEFDAHECWGTMSVKPDANDGHATCGLAWGDGFAPIVDTWTKPQCTTVPFTQACQDGLILVLTQAWVDQGGNLDAMVEKWGLTTAAEMQAPTPSVDTKPDIFERIAEDVEQAAAKVGGVGEHVEQFIRDEVERAVKSAVPNILEQEFERLASQYFRSRPW